MQDKGHSPPPTLIPSELSKLARSCCLVGAISDWAVKGPKYPVKSIIGQSCQPQSWAS